MSEWKAEKYSRSLKRVLPPKAKKTKSWRFFPLAKTKKEVRQQNKKSPLFRLHGNLVKETPRKEARGKKKWNCVCVLIAVLVCASAGCWFRHRLWFSDLQTAALLWKCKNTLWPQSSREAIIEGGTNLWRAPGCWTSTENFGIGGSCWFEKKSPSSFKR